MGSADAFIISPEAARRFLLGRQGLWPGRRWSATGTGDAMRALVHLQLDPLNMIARNQDLLLQSRVVDYPLEHWERLTYKERGFFDWGNWLAVRPMEELPFYRTLMARIAKTSARARERAREHGAAIRYVRRELEKRGPLGNRDLEGLKRVTSYRGRKDTAVALFQLWITGEVMTHHRRRFERVYDLAERVAPAELLTRVSDAEADRFLTLRTSAFYGLTRLQGLYGWLGYDSRSPISKKLPTLLARDGLLAPVRIDGGKSTYWANASEIPILEELNAGRTPSAWKALGPETDEEVIFLAPLDPVSARGRSKEFFGFDYVWEVYKPEAKRLWGYYVLPFIYGDRLAGRADFRLVRETRTLEVLGLWVEDRKHATDARFIEAVRQGLERFALWLAADRIKILKTVPAGLKKTLARPR